MDRYIGLTGIALNDIHKTFTYDTDWL